MEVKGGLKRQTMNSANNERLRITVRNICITSHMSSIFFFRPVLGSSFSLFLRKGFLWPF